MSANPTNGTPEELVEALSRTHRHVAMLAAHDVLRDWTLAEDAAQLGFLLILNRLRSGDATLMDRPDAVVRRNARWAAMKIRAARLKSETAEDRYGRQTPADDEGPWSSTEARFVCEAILDSLPEHYREAISLRFFRQLPDAVAASQLHVTLRAYRRRLDRAMALARSVAGDLGVRGAASVLVALRGVRALLHRARRLGDLGFVWGTPVTNTTALAVIAFATAGPALVAAAPHVAAPPLIAADGPAQPAAAVVARVAAGGNGSQLRSAAAASSSAQPTPPPTHHTPADDETPADTTFYSAAAAPGDNGQPLSVVAIGFGHTCLCNVVFESRDGWHTWTAGAGPDAGLAGPMTQVTLPPTYPRDPRILLGNPAVGTTLDMVSSGFRQPFNTLPVTGYITLPPSFESDGVFLVGIPAGMAGYTMTGTAVSAAQGRPVVFSPPVVGETDVLSAAAGGGEAAFALGGTNTSQAAVDSSTVSGVSVNSVGLPTLYRCAATISCQRAAASPNIYVSGFSVSLHYATDHMLALYGGGDDVRLSSNSGQTFSKLPATGGTVEWVAVTSTAGAPAVWATVAGPTGWSAMRWDGGTTWRTVSPVLWRHAVTATTHPILLGADRGVIFRAAGGAVCTADGGATWAETCPA